MAAVRRRSPVFARGYYGLSSLRLLSVGQSCSEPTLAVMWWMRPFPQRGSISWSRPIWRTWRKILSLNRDKVLGDDVRGGGDSGLTPLGNPA